MADTQNTAKVDILHPLSAIDWKQCHKWKDYYPTHCAVLHDKLAILAQKYASRDILHMSSMDLRSWATTALPYEDMALATYKSQFVLVGGRDRSAIDVVLTSGTGLEWQPSLPPMTTKRSNTTCISTRSQQELIVAGGFGDGWELDVVEVLIDNNWHKAHPLHKPCGKMTATLHQDEVVFTHWLSFSIYSCSIASLISSCTQTNTYTPVWTEIKAPDIYTTTISYSSHLVNINEYGGIRGYCSRSQSWVEVYRPDKERERIARTAATLPTGDIVVAGRYGVYRVKVSVSTYDPGSKFQSDVLSRLEEVMGIQIMSVLGKNHSQLTTSSGVKLQTRKYVRGREIALPDPQSDPVLYVEEVIVQWSMRRSHRPPTWKQLMEVFQEMRLRELSQQIEAFMRGDAMYIHAYRHFISTKDIVEMLFLKFLFLGMPRQGKTTARRRLMGEIEDLFSAGEAVKPHASTGIVESGHDMIVQGLTDTTAMITGRDWSAVHNLTDEARILFHNFVDNVHSQATTAPAQPRPEKPVTKGSATEAQVTAAATRPAPDKSEPGLVQRFFSTVKSMKANRKKAPKRNDIPEITALFKTVSKNSELWKDMKHSFRAYLRMEDTGGQPELMDMLPALNVGPGLYLLFFSYECDLKSYFKVYYERASGETTKFERSAVTLEEMLLSSLSSISSSNISGTALGFEESSDTDMQEILQSSKSVAYIVGTHKDKVSAEHIASFDKELQKVIRDTDFFEKEIVQFFSKDQLVISMDNMKGGKEEVCQIQKLLEHAMEKHFQKLRIPAVWLLFSLCLRMTEVRTASMETCLALSSAFNMTPYETKVALWFLHHHAGVMMYFPNVSGLEDLVIVDIQVVYDSITCVILKAMSFGSVGLATAEKFRTTGQFSLSVLVSATAEVSGDLIPPLKLVALLEYLHIIAKIIACDSSSQCSDTSDNNYIMPCVLRSASKEELDAISRDPSCPSFIAPLRVRYNCGFVPIGVFPAMTASFIGNYHLFQLVQSGVMKNMVQFHYGAGFALVTFLARPKSYDVVISELPKGNHEPHILCSELRKEIEVTLEKVSSRMNYGHFLDYQFGFKCPTHPDEDHVCVVDRRTSSPQAMLCLQNLKKKVSMEMCNCHKLWYGEPPEKQRILPAVNEGNRIHSLDPDNIMTLFHEAFPSSKASELGTYLEVPRAKLHDFSYNHNRDCDAEMLAVLNYWLENGKDRTWRKLAAAVEQCGYKVLSENIRLKHS